MSIQQPTARTTTRTTTRTARHARTDGPPAVASVLVCLAIMAGGLVGAQHWLTAQCPTTPDLAQVCAAAGPLL